MAVDASELSEIYDVPTLLENSMGDVEFAEELLDRFNSRLEMIEQALQSLVLEGDFRGAASEAHSLKGEAGVLAARRVQEIAAQLERALQTSDHGDVEALLNQLRTAADQCLGANVAARSALSQFQPSAQ